MSKPQRLYETKSERSRRLSVGAWFVWPDTTPRRHKYYQPRVYRALGNGKVSAAVYQDIGIWQHAGGVNSPDAARSRCDEIARTLNAIHADEHAAAAHVKRLRDQRIREASEAVSQALNDANRSRDI